MAQGSTVSDDRSGDERDPDAPWRPGFDGWSNSSGDRPHGMVDRGLRSGGDETGSERWSREHDQQVPEPWVPVRPTRTPPPPVVPDGPPVAVVDGQPPSSVTGELFLVGLAVLSALLVAASAAVLLPSNSTDVSSIRAPLLPSEADIAWTGEVPGVVDDVAVGVDVLVATTNEGVTAFDLETGDVRWEREFGDDAPLIDATAVIEGQLVVQLREPGGRSVVEVVHAATGDAAWASADETGSVTIGGTTERPLIMRRDRVDDTTVLEVLGPLDGRPAGEAVRLSSVSASGEHLAVQPSNRRVALWSIDDEEVVAGPVDSFNLRTVAALHGVVVALDLDGRIVVFDETGLRADEQPFVSDAFGEFTGRAELAGVVESAGVGIIASGSSLGFTADDGSIETVWQRPGRVFDPVVTEAGPRSVLVGPAEASGEIRQTIIDPADGSTIVVTDAEGKREAPPLVGHDGYLLAPGVGAAERVVEAFEHDGSPRWSLAIGAGVNYEILGGVVVLVERTPDGSTVSVAR